MIVNLFDDEWVRKIKVIPTTEKSWVHEVKVPDTNGRTYLSFLRDWFNEFPVNARQKQVLAKRLESIRNDDHLGAVNELAWWKLIQKEQFQANPIPPVNSSTPDFYVKDPSEFFMEVSTLNVSKKDGINLKTGDSVELNDAETLRRILGKFTKEKQQQLSYGADRKTPSVLILFDYTFSSNFGTEFYEFLGDFLLGKQQGFQYLPIELSVLVYIERKFLKGRIGVSQLRSATYYNPNAKYPLPVGTFAQLQQFGRIGITPKLLSTDGWIWL
ncbi:MAG: hypothetical protein ABI618_06440 [Nitrospirota bacterium]